MMTRLTTLFATALVLLAVAAPLSPLRAETAAPDPLSESSILRDPDIPTLGNEKGDITIVEYFDYQCPYCRKVNPELTKIVRDDGHIRLVFKDWPIFGEASVYATRLALASKYQGKFPEAHEALISLRERLSEDKVDGALPMRDPPPTPGALDAILARNHQQALAFGFQGTPAFIIGHFRIPGAPNTEAFKQAIADARAAERKKK
jgi:protein-disulfide isomerase